jgi:uncharacterized membrane protein YraQ (UPF0718 family)
MRTYLAPDYNLMSGHSCEDKTSPRQASEHQPGEHQPGVHQPGGHQPGVHQPAAQGTCHPANNKVDFLFWGSLIAVGVLYIHYGWWQASTHFAPWYQVLASSVYRLMNTIWWGIAIGILMVALLSKIASEFVMSILGTHNGLAGILRATAAGVLLDLCSHGILMVGAKLYERGAGIGQIMAFFIASPWNSFSLTLILISLIGIPWTFGFIALSMIIAIVVGLIFNRLVS